MTATALLSQLSDRIVVLAVARGMELAETFFAKRVTGTEVHLNKAELAGVFALGFEEGMLAGMAAVRGAKP